MSRKMLEDGTLRRYIDDWFVTGLTSNPTTFDKAVSGGDRYDDSIAALAPRELPVEDLFRESPWPSSPTRPGANCWFRSAGSGWRGRAG